MALPISATQCFLTGPNHTSNATRPAVTSPVSSHTSSFCHGGASLRNAPGRAWYANTSSADAGMMLLHSKIGIGPSFFAVRVIPVRPHGKRRGRAGRRLRKS